MISSIESKETHELANIKQIIDALYIKNVPYQLTMNIHVNETMVTVDAKDWNKMLELAAKEFMLAAVFDVPEPIAMPEIKYPAPPKVPKGDSPLDYIGYNQYVSSLNDYIFSLNQYIISLNTSLVGNNYKPFKMFQYFKKP